MKQPGTFLLLTCLFAPVLLSNVYAVKPIRSISLNDADSEGFVAVGKQVELFADNHLIETMAGAALKLHSPVQRDVAIIHDKPWEGNISYYHTVFEDDNLYRMYYRGAHFDETTQKVTHQVVCYAESDDGINWKKPNLGIIEFNGSKENNIIWQGKGSHNFAPFLDTNPACRPKERYKALAGGPLQALKSADGLHWTLLQKEPVITEGAFDSQNQAFYDTLRGRYVAYHRDFNMKRRDIKVTTSDDFLTWTDPDWIEYPGAPPEHLYTNQIKPYFRSPGVYIGFPKRFLPSRTKVEHSESGVSDIVFMTSRDGRDFKRWTEAIIRPGLQRPRWVTRNNFVANGILETASDLPGCPPELSIYSMEGYYRGPDCSMRRYTYRMDGFVSVNAPLSGGELITRPLMIGFPVADHDKIELVINYATSAAGSIRCEILGLDGKPLADFTLDRGRVIYGDEIEHTVTWNKGSNIKDAVTDGFKLRFVLQDADLYSLRLVTPS